MRDALEFEWLGIPSVAFIADALQGPAEAMARLSGMDGYEYVITPFPVGALDQVQLRERAQSHVETVLRLLTSADREQLRQTPVAELATGLAGQQPRGTAANWAASLSEDEIHAEFVRRGFTDGLPVIIPTSARVDALLAVTDRDPSEVVVALETRDGLAATVEGVAVNAVMAGVVPRHFPVVLAALDAMARPEFNLHAHTATMVGAQQVMIVRGPVAPRLGFRSEDGALGPGWPANSTVSRAVRLVIRNLLRSVHGEFDRSGFSHPGRVGWCWAEDHRSPWPMGEQDCDEVLAYATSWQASVINHDQDAASLLDEIGFAVRAACHANWLHHDVASDSIFAATRPFLFVTGAEHARVLVRDGYHDIEVLRAALYQRLVSPDDRLRRVAIADPDNIHISYLHATGMQQTWFFAPFQSHAMTRSKIVSSSMTSE